MQHILLTDTPHGWILAALDDVERLQDDNKYVCERCCHLVEAERSMHYVTLPRILTLHLKRFAATSRYVHACDVCMHWDYMNTSCVLVVVV